MFHVFSPVSTPPPKSRISEFAPFPIPPNGVIFGKMSTGLEKIPSVPSMFKQRDLERLWDLQKIRAFPLYVGCGTRKNFELSLLYMGPRTWRISFPANIWSLRVLPYI